MHKDTITLDELFEMQDSLLDHVVTVRGTFALNARGAYITDASPDIAMPAADSLKVLILQEGLEERCFKTIPAWGGGLYYYFDEALIRGRLVSSTASGSQLALTDLSSLEVRRGDERYQAFN